MICDGEHGLLRQVQRLRGEVAHVGAYEAHEAIVVDEIRVASRGEKATRAIVEQALEHTLGVGSGGGGCRGRVGPSAINAHRMHRACRVVSNWDNNIACWMCVSRS